MWRNHKPRGCPALPEMLQCFSTLSCNQVTKDKASNSNVSWSKYGATSCKAICSLNSEICASSDNTHFSPSKASANPEEFIRRRHLNLIRSFFASRDCIGTSCQPLYCHVRFSNSTKTTQKDSSPNVSPCKASHVMRRSLNARFSVSGCRCDKFPTWQNQGTVIQETQRKILVTRAKSHKIICFSLHLPFASCLYGLKLARTKQFGQRWSFHLWKLCGTKIQMPKLSASLLEDLQRSSGRHQFESFPQTHEAVSRCFPAEAAKALQLQLATAESAQDIANARAFQQALTLPEDWLQVASCRTPNLCIYIYIYTVWSMSHSFATIASIPSSPICLDISKCTLSQPDLHTQQAEENPRQTSAASIPKQNLPGNCWIRKSKKNINSSGFCVKKHPTLRRVKRRKGESEVKMSCLSYLRLVHFYDQKQKDVFQLSRHSQKFGASTCVSTQSGS